MINEIALLNWKTHKSTNIKFQKGANVLVGVMGAGKSSIMDAISFALFGTFPALNSKRVTLSGIVSNRPTAEEEAEVQLSFNVGDDDFTVTRRIGPKGTTSRLDKNGSYLQTQPSKVTEEMERILGMDYDTFSRTIYSEQNRLDYFLDLEKGRRKKQIDQMLGLDSFTVAEENTTSLINNIRNMISSEEEALSRIDIKAAKENLDKLLSERSSMQKEQKALSERLASVKNALEKSREELDSLKKRMQRRKDLEEELAKLNSRKSTLEEEIKKIAELGIDESTVATELKVNEQRESSFSKEVADLRKRERILSGELSDAGATIASCEKRLKEKASLEKDKAGLEGQDIMKKLEEENANSAKLSEELAGSRSRLKELLGWSRELKKHISKCPVCDRELDELMKERLLKEKSDEARMLEKESAEAEKKLEASVKACRQLTELTNRLSTIRSRLADYKDVREEMEKAAAIKKEKESQLEKETKAIAEKEKELDLIRKEASRLRVKADSIARRKAYESEVKKTLEKIAIEKKALDGIDVDQSSVDKAQDAFTSYTAMRSEISSKIAATERAVGSMDPQIAEKEKEMKSLGEMEKRITRRRNQLSNLNKFKTSLVETQAQLRNRLVSSINDLMRGLWPGLYPYGDYSSIRLDAKHDDYSLDLCMGDGGNERWAAVDAIASGGERSIACLAMRIALAMVIVPNLRWLILDEPTHNLDDRGIGKLIDVIGNTLPGVVEQIFIITHDESMKQISSARIYQLEREKRADGGYTVVSEI